MFTLNLESKKHLLLLAIAGFSVIIIFVVAVMAGLNEQDYDKGVLDNYPRIINDLKWVEEVELRCQSIHGVKRGISTEMTHVDLYKDLKGGDVRQCTGRFSYDGDSGLVVKTLERMGFIRFASYSAYAGGHEEIWRKPPKKAEETK